VILYLSPIYSKEALQLILRRNHEMKIFSVISIFVWILENTNFAKIPKMLKVTNSCLNAKNYTFGKSF
jgi:hypothetical protein